MAIAERATQEPRVNTDDQDTGGDASGHHGVNVLIVCVRRNPVSSCPVIADRVTRPHDKAVADPGPLLCRCEARLPKGQTAIKRGQRLQSLSASEIIQDLLLKDEPQ